MSKLHNRLTQLEKKRNANTPARIFVYFYDKEKGYGKSGRGPFYPTFDELAAVLGWQPSETDTKISVEYASQNKIFIPDNGRELSF